MATKVRLTPAQWRGLALLARPGAEAKTARWLVYWPVAADGHELGRVHATTLARLRDLGLAEMVNGGEHPLDLRQRITTAGRAALESRP